MGSRSAACDGAPSREPYYLFARRAFITHHCPVVEFGLVGQTMHQINERVPVADLQKLTGIYRKIIDRYFA